jgi:hypothetical protein
MWEQAAITNPGMDPVDELTRLDTSLSYIYLTNKVTNSMEQSPSWEAYSHSASQKFPAL